MVAGAQDVEKPAAVKETETGWWKKPVVPSPRFASPKASSVGITEVLGHQ